MTAKTPLYDWHAGHGGTLVEFAGWWLPVAYGPGVIAEHLACRKHGGLFDISHMGRFGVAGPGATTFLERVLANRAGKLVPGRAHYTLISDPLGRPLDDAYLYRLDEERYLLVVNAANKDKAWDWLKPQTGPGVELTDLSGAWAMLAAQGPDSEALVAGLLDEALPPAGRNHCGLNHFQGKELLVSRTGYTGEPVGFELFPAWDDAPALWEALASAGAGMGVLPVGLGARDTLRLEAGLPLYGHEYAADRPIMAVPTARLGVDLSPDRGEFVGRKALLAQTDNALPPRRIMAVAGLAKGMMREGSPVIIGAGGGGGQEIGVLTSATMVPAWRFDGDAPGDEHYNRPLGLALLDSAAQVGQELEIVYRKRVIPGRVVKSFARPAGRYLQPIEFM